jgi:hypothetical protein
VARQLTAASIGAATFRFAAAARSTGAGPDEPGHRRGAAVDHRDARVVLDHPEHRDNAAPDGHGHDFHAEHDEHDAVGSAKARVNRHSATRAARVAVRRAIRE